MLAFVSDLKKPTDIVNIDELVAGLKAKHGEYARMNNKHLEKQTQHLLDSHFADVNETNIRKQFYKKKDLFKQTEESGEELPDVANNEELVEHKSANMLNNMLPIMTTLGKRTATNDGEGLPEKRKKLASMLSFTKDKMAAQAAEEMLNKYLVEPSVKYSDIGGLDSVIKQLREMIEWPLKYSDIFQFLGVKPPKGILISGPPGTGKTQLALAIAGENPEIPFYRLNAPEFVSQLSGQSEEKIRQVFAGVREKAPAVIFIDELDCIAGKRENASKDMEVRIVAQLASCLDELDGAEARVVVVGVTTRPEYIDQGLRRAGRFEREITLGVPNEEARVQILKVLTRGMRLRPDFPFEELVKYTPGYVGADLQTLIKEASILAVERAIGCVKLSHPDTQNEESENSLDLDMFYIELDDFKHAAKLVKPSAQREGFSTVPNTTWQDVGALSAVRDELHMSIVEPILNPERFRQIGLSAPAGVLLYGPPGCGKTLVARAVSNESKANFISIKGPELLNKYVGESEKAVRQLFKRAMSSAPCVIFFDELDSLCPKRGSENNSSSERVVNQLLTEMDGLEERRGVFVIAATNRPDIIDPAMLRPGRLDKLLYVPLPTKEDRLQILQTLCRKVPITADVDLKKIAFESHCDGFSGADLSALVREAQMSALKARMQSDNQEGSAHVEHKDFILALSKVFPSVSKKDELSYRALEGSLRKTRAHINPAASQPESVAEPAKPTPRKL